MHNSRALRFLFSAAILIGFSTAAFGQATRTWVSGVGDDANPCSRTAPCKTFAGAISKTAPAGEISVLDPGGFGAVTITKGMTINGTGTLAGILFALANAAVIVNAGANDTIILRDISMNGAGSGVNGIRYLAGKTLMVDHCWIYGLTTNGIDVSKSTDGNLKVIDTIIENVGADGIHMTTTVGNIVVTVDHCRIMNAVGDAIEGVNNIKGAVLNSDLGYAAGGIKTSGTNALINIDDTYISFCGVGLQSSAGSSLRVSDSIIAQNGTGLNANGGTIDSFQGNSLIGNSTPGAFNSTTNKQ